MKKWALKVYFGTLGVWTNLLGRLGQGVTLRRKDGEASSVGGGAGALCWIGFLREVSVRLHAR